MLINRDQSFLYVLQTRGIQHNGKGHFTDFQYDLACEVTRFPGRPR
jgi:hypothetical protein